VCPEQVDACPVANRAYSAILRPTCTACLRRARHAVRLRRLLLDARDPPYWRSIRQRGPAVVCLPNWSFRGQHTRTRGTCDSHVSVYVRGADMSGRVLPRGGCGTIAVLSGPAARTGYHVAGAVLEEPDPTVRGIPVLRLGTVSSPMVLPLLGPVMRPSGGIARHQVRCPIA
jgi:hypothetical protein